LSAIRIRSKQREARRARFDVDVPVPRHFHGSSGTGAGQICVLALPLGPWRAVRAEAIAKNELSLMSPSRGLRMKYHVVYDVMNDGIPRFGVALEILPL
jgi:hypothetical protein